jgi:hypothetical protein
MNYKWTELSNCQKEDQLIFETWNTLPENYCQPKTVAFGILTIFGSTYYCEQAFSNIDLPKPNTLIDVVYRRIRHGIRRSVT